ncbi:MAG: PDZ domain-containing protein [Rubripirellula sp.]
MKKVAFHSTRVLCCLALLACLNSVAADTELQNSPASDAPEQSTSVPAKDASTSSQASRSPSPIDADSEIAPELPWDYLPYRVLVWLVSEDPAINVDSIEEPLRAFLDRDFAAVWQTDLAVAPAAIRTHAIRNIGGLDYDLITSSDPVLAVKRDHKDAVRIRIAQNVGEFVTKIYCTPGRVESIKARAAAAGDETMAGVVDRLEAIEGDEIAVRDLWVKPETQGLLVSRGMAQTLDKPEAKLISAPVSNLIGEAVDSYDKIFVVKVTGESARSVIEVVELDTLMRHFGPVATVISTEHKSIPLDVGRGLTKAFAPVIRIENSGQKNAAGLLRAGGLILDKHSPAAVRPNDVLEPMIRKNDRNGKPILIGPIDWAYLNVVEPEIALIRGVNGAGFKPGDQIATIDGTRLLNSQQVDSLFRERAAGKLEVEVDRGEKQATLSIDLKKTPMPLRTQYLGFTAREQRDNIVITAIMEEGPAEEKLEVGDELVSVNGVPILSLSDLARLVLTGKQPAKLKVLRDGADKNVAITPTEEPSRDQREIQMDFYAGRSGGLQGRKNQRTFRMALKTRPFLDSTEVRLHLQREPDFPLIGYEIYQKELKSSKMTFIGRTDWNGRLPVQRDDEALRLFYVKNGGAVLARLPVVPGLYSNAVADLSGDDLRLQAEAYIRGVQNSIVDLIAIRELFKARIRLRLGKGEVEKAEELMKGLRGQPSNEILASEMGKKQTVFLKLLGNRNANQRRKVDEMFTTTRELLGKHISPKLVRDLEADLIAVRDGKPLPNRDKKSEDESEPEQPAKKPAGKKKAADDEKTSAEEK